MKMPVRDDAPLWFELWFDLMSRRAAEAWAAQLAVVDALLAGERVAALPEQERRLAAAFAERFLNADIAGDAEAMAATTEMLSDSREKLESRLARQHVLEEDYGDANF